MVPECLLEYSHEFAAGPHPEPNKSNQYDPILFLRILNYKEQF
jgi:hypothetical protein